MFNEISFIFWNTSYARDGHFMNIWLGPQEREYVRALQDFSYRLDADVRMVAVTCPIRRRCERYGLRSAKQAAVYLHHFQDHQHACRGLQVTLDVPVDATAYWYHPETAAILRTEPVAAGQQTLTAPEFTVDLALLVTPDGPPDIDRDGIPNDRDPDDDNDGVTDARTPFRWSPRSGRTEDDDLIGDNLDADIDGDGQGDDRNRTARRTTRSWTSTATACRGPTPSPGTRFPGTRRNGAIPTATAWATTPTRMTTATVFPTRKRTGGDQSAGPVELPGAVDALL